jgi:iron complex transport system permease protein
VSATPEVRPTVPGRTPGPPPLPRGVRFGSVVSFVWRPRPTTVTVALAALAFLAFCAGLRLGDYPLSFTEVLQGLVGRGPAPIPFIVHDLRLPRALMGLIVGAALGMSGAIVQSIARNPLASPDILGISAGAGVAAVFLVTSTGTLAATLNGDYGLPVVALVGGLATGAVVYLLAVRGGVDGIRLILIGVAISALMRALIDWMLIRADIRDVGRAQAWLVGSLDARTWSQVCSTGSITAVAGLFALGCAFALRAVQLGDDVALGLGVRLGVTRGLLLVAAVLLAAIAVAGAGPIAFVAFVAPQLAMRLTRLPAPPLIPSAVAGAALLTAADLAARTLFPVALPVGIVTAAAGGPFLVYLLIRQNLRNSR